ncbi:MAG TPA: hypothetical protein VHL53_12620 [Acidimicrobiia bacterium]|nr:hypothetical protein [Acidimicrobiia bacterium]
MQAEKTAPSVVIALFADRLVPAKGGMLDQGMDAPLTGARISVKPLAELLLAATLWDLRESGAVGFSVEAKKGLLRAKKVLRIERRSGTPGVGGIAAGVLGAIDAGADSPKDVVRRWLGGSRANPWGDVVTAGLIEVAAGGLGDLDDSGKSKMKSVLGAVPKLVADAARAADLEPAFGAFKAVWDGFLAAEGELAAELLGGCKSALSSIASTD